MFITQNIQKMLVFDDKIVILAMKDNSYRPCLFSKFVQFSKTNVLSSIWSLYDEIDILTNFRGKNLFWHKILQSFKTVQSTSMRAHFVDN